LIPKLKQPFHGKHFGDRSVEGQFGKGVVWIGMTVNAGGVYHLPCNWQQTVDNLGDYWQAV
jgi:hypothetical protein